MQNEIMEIKDVNSELETILLTNNIVLVDVWAEWCGPCKMLNPVLHELQDKYPDILQVVKINADENAEFLIKHSIRSIPTMLFFKNNNFMSKLVGFKSLSELSNYIKTL